MAGRGAQAEVQAARGKFVPGETPVPVSGKVLDASDLQRMTDAVLDGKHSVIYEQAANRTHVQKALLMQLLK